MPDTICYHLSVNMEGDRNEGRLINGDDLNVDD